MRGRLPDALEVVSERLAQLTHQLVEALCDWVGHQHVFQHRYPVLQNAVHQDDVDTGEFDVALHPLLRHLALVGDELERQLLQLGAARAVADIGLFHLLSPAKERLAHPRQPIAHQHFGVAVWCPEEGGVALQLGQLQAFAGVDDRLQQRRHRRLRMGQVCPVRMHVVRVSADVGNEENGAPEGHELGGRGYG